MFPPLTAWASSRNLGIKLFPNPVKRVRRPVRFAASSENADMTRKTAPTKEENFPSCVHDDPPG